MNVNCIWSEPPMPSQKRIVFSLVFLMFCALAQAQRPRPRQLRVNNRGFQHIPRQTNNAQNQICNRGPYRTIDGTCNNISQADRIDWGASDILLFREMPARYGQPDDLNDMAGENRPSPRAISNAVGPQSEDIPSQYGLSSLVFSWGQFLDHDIDLTPEEEAEYHPILLPDDEPLFAMDIPFFRSSVHEGTGEDSPRQQTNLITSWIDASNVYGSEETRANWLRTFTDGKLKTSAGDLLPYNTIDGEYDSAIDPNAPSMAGDHEGTVVLFVAGDVRANEQSGLTALHTLFVREHNRLCDQLKSQGIRGDEELYQLARKRVGAYIQRITYEEFLPSLGIRLAPYRNYRPDVRPDISNLFATAAYRLGHTMVTNEIPLRDNNCNDVSPGSLSLLEVFFNTDPIRDHGIGPILKGLSTQYQQEIDLKIIDNLRNFLFGNGNSGPPFGLDLASLNLQRGRDHGLPSYNVIRAQYLGRPASSYSQINPDPQVVEALTMAYGNRINQVDAWVGLLAERQLPGSSVGPSLHAILKDQFEKLRDGDYYFYQNDPLLQRRDQDDIRRTSLSSIIRRNTSVTRLSPDAFHSNPCFRGTANSRQSDATESELATEQVLSIAPNPSPGQIKVQIALAEGSKFRLRILD
ncbi:MAG: peroxidase family protein, partial [Bacteroidota bacterium]